jgi:hypothetical protein
MLSITYTNFPDDVKTLLDNVLNEDFDKKEDNAEYVVVSLLASAQSVPAPTWEQGTTAAIRKCGSYRTGGLRELNLKARSSRRQLPIAFTMRTEVLISTSPMRPKPEICVSTLC